MKVLILDNEAVDALRDAGHPHHRRVFALYEVNRSPKRQFPGRRTVVPTAVRTEAGWDRTAPDAAGINRLAIEDVPLEGTTVDRSAALVTVLGVSVADAHIGATIEAFAGSDITVATSDPKDVRAVAGSQPVTIVTL